uniref:Uncharacterized protein n=1 Tax=Anguilla anguilla TaxID=7936 RepID=A0A0E9X4I6_ANGAN
MGQIIYCRFAKDKHFQSVFHIKRNTHSPSFKIPSGNFYFVFKSLMFPIHFHESSSVSPSTAQTCTVQAYFQGFIA